MWTRTKYFSCALVFAGKMFAELYIMQELFDGELKQQSLICSFDGIVGIPEFVVTKLPIDKIFSEPNEAMILYATKEMLKVIDEHRKERETVWQATENLLKVELSKRG